MENKTPLLSLKNVSKSFSGVAVLKGVDFSIRAGEVHALIGENGAGKSTLVKIISGVHSPTSGEIVFEGNPTKILSPHMAREMGIALINQEPLSFPDLNVVENIYLGHTRDGKHPTINWKEKIDAANKIFEALDISFKATDPVKNMSVADQQMIEIVNALSQNAKIIIMDEPTAALSKFEVENLFKTINKLKDSGKAIVFIGHRLDEILEISDTITVLRDGEYVGELEKSEATEDKLVQMMIGRSFSGLISKTEAPIGEERLRVEAISNPGKYSNVSLSVKAGEIVGLAGLVGAGRSEVAAGIYGTMPIYSGKIYINGQETTIKTPRDSKKHGIAMVSEDRAKTGLMLPASISHNMVLPFLKFISRFGFVSNSMEEKIVDSYIKSLNIKTRNRNQTAKELSGGNQQKVVIAKALMLEPEILILDEPTRGIDVGAKAEVYKLIGDLAKQGKAILMISSEMQEIVELSDRVYVMCEGRVTDEIARKDISSERIMVAASSVKTETRGA